MSQIDLYRQIDELFENGFNNADSKAAFNLADVNAAASEYFFGNAPVEWAFWLYKNGFFQKLSITEETADAFVSAYSRVRYLSHVINTGGYEDVVVSIMNDVDLTKPENLRLIDQFLYVVRRFSANGLKRILPKIRDEKWIARLKEGNPTGHSYKEIVETLVEAQEVDSLLLLTEVMLQVDIEKVDVQFSRRYFYLSDIEETGIFDALMCLEGEYVVKAISILSKVFKQLLQSKKSEDSVFQHSDAYYLNDIDFFDLDFDGREPLPFREDIKNLLKVYVHLVGKGMSSSESERVFDEIISKLPDSQTLWRVKLFAMSRQPNAYKDAVKKELERIFSTKRYGQLLFGTEYLNTLRITFPLWSEDDRRDYVSRIFDKFKQLINKAPEEHWHAEQGWEVLSVIAENLTDSERQLAEEIFGKALDVNFVPKITIHEMRGGMVQDQSPEAFTDVKDVEKVIEKLKADLSPKALIEKYRSTEDFLKPKNAQGVSNELRDDMKRRMSSYLEHSKLFLDKDLHIHYTYAFLQGVEEYLRDKNILSEDDWDHLFEMFVEIMNTPKRKEEDVDDRLADWTWVERNVADLLKFFLTDAYKDLFASKRNTCLNLITFLSKSADPSKEYDEESKSDLFHVAINSTRGRSFECLASFAFFDGKELKEDVFELYKQTIEEATPSVRFVIGRYLWVFYFRDKDQVSQLFEGIFPTDSSSFLASWEGYLSNSIYQELFEALDPYYQRALEIDSSDYPDRRMTRDLDEAIGTHLALSFAHFDEVQYSKGSQHPLIDLLFTKGSVEKQKSFISFLGRGIVSHGDVSEEWLKSKNVSVDKLKDLWMYLLALDLSSDTYSAFGTWVNHRSDFQVFDSAWLARKIAETLIKSEGIIDWEYGTEKRLLEFANADPEATLIIFEKIFLGSLVNAQRLNWFSLDDDQIEAFRVLYEFDHEKTEDLINQLLIKGGKPFWPLKDIINKKSA